MLRRLIAKGASGGRGAESNQITSHGSIVKVTLFLRQGEKIYILVGQEGSSVCSQVRVFQFSLPIYFHPLLVSCYYTVNK